MTKRNCMVWGVILLVLLPVVGLAVLSLTTRRPTNLGVHNGRLAECPSSPNCVSSQASDEAHRIAPLACGWPKAEALRRLEHVLTTFPRVTIVSRDDGYLHAEFRSALFRFVDDVEFVVSESESVIHVRSASRAGHSDLGVNRRRVELIRQRLSE